MSQFPAYVSEFSFVRSKYLVVATIKLQYHTHENRVLIQTKRESTFDDDRESH